MHSTKKRQKEQRSHGKVYYDYVKQTLFNDEQQRKQKNYILFFL